MCNCTKDSLSRHRAAPQGDTRTKADGVHGRKVTDVFSKSKRSEVMARIRSRGNKSTEMAFARLLRAHRITGWRRHLSIKLSNGNKLAKTGGQVKPDFIFPKFRVAVFIDGCFWHGCRSHGSAPSGNREFWRHKLAANRTRDRYVNRMLRKAGWTVLRFWEHQIKRGSETIFQLQRKIDTYMAADRSLHRSEFPETRLTARRQGARTIVLEKIL